MTYVLVVAPCLVALALLWVLLAGQPAGQASLLAENTALRATIMAYPTPTPRPFIGCLYGTRTTDCRP